MEPPFIQPTAPAPASPTAADVRRAFETRPDDAARVMFDFNKQALARAMRAAGLASVEVTYSGSGDSGQIDEVEFDPPGVDARTHHVLVARMHYRWDEERCCGANEPLFEELSLADAAETLCDQAITLCDHDGYENGDGGSGTFTLQAADAAAELDHRDYYTESLSSVHPL
jgi:hypothetical protein